MKKLRDRYDLEVAARAIADHFRTDRVVVIGSQAVLLEWPDAPTAMKVTPEIDMYPSNWADWEKQNPGFEASEEINALFGQMSQFEERYGFYIDGVDESTARLPPDWAERQVEIQINVYGRPGFVVAPCLDDIIVSKLHRLDQKDINFIEVVADARGVHVPTLLARLRSTEPDPAILARAEAFLGRWSADRLPRLDPFGRDG